MKTTRTRTPVTASDSGAEVAPRGAFRHPMPMYLELIKARLTGLVLVTTGVGFVLGSGRHPDWWRLAATLLGTGLAAAGANAFNEWMEIQRDARMERTRERPLPTARMSPRRAFRVASGLSVIGVGILGFAVNTLTAGLGAFVILLYTLAYTPLKKRTPFCTLVGAVCGAIPPVMGWTGAIARIGTGALFLGAILFLWQIPHFLSLAWLYRADYARGGFRMLPSIDATGRLTGGLAVVYAFALLPAGLVGVTTGIAGWVYFSGSLALGTGLVLLAVGLRRERSERSARSLFLGSIIYLPLLLLLLLADPGPVLLDPGPGMVPAIRFAPASGAAASAGAHLGSPPDPAGRAHLTGPPHPTGRAHVAGDPSGSR
jgi:protoheme IX farnesyltransferase